jgi:sorting nexin-29
MKQDERQWVCVNGELFDNLRFADDIDLLEHNCERLQRSLNSVAVAAEQMGLRINRAKTKVMVFSDKHPTGMIRLEEEEAEIEWVEQFVYLGSLITSDNDCSKEIRRRIALATGAMAGFNKIWRSKDIHMNVKTAEMLLGLVF